MPAPLNVHRRLSSTIKKFRFEELESSVVPIFPETSWNRIRSKLLKQHQKFTAANALCIIEAAINEANVSEKELKERLAILETIEVSRHHKKKLWYSFMMTERNSEDRNLFAYHEIQSRIVENFRTYAMEVDVRITTHDGIIYVSMRDKPTGKQSSRMTSVFFAIFLGHEYIFCSKANVTQNCLQAIVDSLGYMSFKKIKLAGRDLHSLMKMLWTKKQGAVDCDNFSDVLEPEIAEPVITSTGIDFRQNKRRREYIEQCFGKDPPTLELLQATGPEQSWKDEEITLKMPDEKVQIQWNFRSLNIAATLTKMVEYRIFAMPLPQYISSWVKLGKNDVKLRNN